MTSRHTADGHLALRTAVVLGALFTGSVAVASELPGDDAPATSVTEARKGGVETVVGPTTAMVVEEEADAEVEDDPASATSKVKKSKTAKRKTVAEKVDLFRPDPQYDRKYDHEEQVEIYGAKFAVDPPRPPIEIGREQYTSGAYAPS